MAAAPRPGVNRYSCQADSSCRVAGVLRKMSTPAVAQAVDDDIEGSLLCCSKT